jgi:hypothetical protein
MEALLIFVLFRYTDITLEREVYKYIALYFQKKYWWNKNEKYKKVF